MDSSEPGAAVESIGPPQQRTPVDTPQQHPVQGPPELPAAPPADRQPAASSDDVPRQDGPADRGGSGPAGPADTGERGEAADASQMPNDDLLRREAATRRARREGLHNLTAENVHETHIGDRVGRDAHYHFATSPRLPSGTLPPTTFERLRLPYWRPDSHDRLVRQLDTCRVQILRGHPGTGRTSTAVMALDERLRRTDGSGEIVVLAENLDPGTLTSATLEKPAGYLLRCSRTPRRVDAAVPAHLKRLVGDRGYFVWVLDTDTELTDDVRNDWTVEHESPPAEHVLRQHLTVLTEDDDLVRDILQSPPVQEMLREGTGSMEHLVTSAAEFVKNSKHDWRRVVEAHQRREAEALLRPAGDSSLGALRSRAFLLACVVLDGLPMVNVTEAAHRLAHRLHLVEEPANPPGRPVFTERLQDYLQHVDAEAVEPADDRTVRGEPVRVRLRRGTMAGTVLEVFWRTYTSAHQPVLEWLDQLARHPEEEVRAKAAQAVGKLATYDYDYLQRTVVQKWAQARGPAAGGLHWCVAWSLEVLYADGRHRGAVRDLVQRWTDPRKQYRRVALRAISVTTGLDEPDEALRALQRIAAATPIAARISTAAELARATEEIYVAAHAAEVLRHLAQWAKSAEPCAQLAAAFCAYRLAWLRSDDGDRPDFLARSADESDTRVLLADLLALLLQQPELQSLVWETLRRWIEYADQQRSLREPLCHLLAEVLRAVERPAPLKVRLRFYLALWSSQGRCHREVAEHIIAEVEGALTA